MYKRKPDRADISVSVVRIRGNVNSSHKSGSGSKFEFTKEQNGDKAANRDLLQRGIKAFFAAVHWRSEIPKIQWIIRQVCVDQNIAETKRTMNHQSVSNRLLPQALPRNLIIWENLHRVLGLLKAVANLIMPHKSPKSQFSSWINQLAESAMQICSKQVGTKIKP